MVHVAPEPARAHASPKLNHRVGLLFRRCSNQQGWKIHTRIYGKLQRAPEAPVDFHEIWLAGTLVHLVLDHRHSLPCKLGEKGQRHTQQLGIDCDTLAIHADTASRRLLTNSAVSELCDELSVPDKYEDPDARTYDSLLQQKRVGARVHTVELRAQFRSRGRMLHGQLEAVVRSCRNRPCRLDD